MPWYIFALGSALFYAATDLLQRLLAVKSKIPRVYSVVFNIYGVLFACFVFVLQGGSFADIQSISIHQYILILCAIVLYGFFERYNIYARKHIEASTFNIIFRLGTVIGFIGSIVLLHEAVTIPKIIGAGLILCASYLVIHKNKKLHASGPLFVAILCAIALGFAFVVDKPASANIKPSLYNFIVWFIPIVIVAFPGIPKKQLFAEFKNAGWPVALSALCNVVGFICYIEAFAAADASRVIPIISIDGIFVVIGGIFLLKEYDHIWRKLLAMVLAFGGVYLLK
jgi:drug/metabolite transporter (DMT)-like permease